jgi:hypothetical protein
MSTPPAEQFPAGGVSSAEDTQTIFVFWDRTLLGWKRGFCLKWKMLDLSFFYKRVNLVGCTKDVYRVSAILYCYHFLGAGCGKGIGFE